MQFGAGIAKSLFDEVEPTDDRVAAAGHQRGRAGRWSPDPALRGRTRPRLAGGGRLRRQPGADELGDLPVVRPDPARHRGHHRVRRAADPGGPRLAAAPRPRSGWCSPGSGSRCSASSAVDLDLGRRRCSRCSPAPRGRRTSCFSAGTGRRWPGLDGLAVASVVATLLLTPLALAAGGDDLLDAAAPAARRGGRPAQLGDPLQLRDGRAALAAPGGVRHPDEPRARRRRAGRRSWCSASSSPRCSGWPWPASSSPASAPPAPAAPHRAGPGLTPFGGRRRWSRSERQG